MAEDDKSRNVEKQPLKERVKRDRALEKMERPAPWPDPPPPKRDNKK